MRGKMLMWLELYPLEEVILFSQLSLGYSKGGGRRVKGQSSHSGPQMDAGEEQGTLALVSVSS